LSIRTDQQADADREKLDFGQRNLDVAGNDQTLVEDPIENIDQTGRMRRPRREGR
jgi:hypothetical protein